MAESDEAEKEAAGLTSFQSKPAPEAAAGGRAQTPRPPAVEGARPSAPTAAVTPTRTPVAKTPLPSLPGAPDPGAAAATENPARIVPPRASLGKTLPAKTPAATLSPPADVLGTTALPEGSKGETARRNIAPAPYPAEDSKVGTTPPPTRVANPQKMPAALPSRVKPAPGRATLQPIPVALCWVLLVVSALALLIAIWAYVL